MPRQNNIRIRRGTAAQWSSSNPILDDGEIGYDKTNNNIKIGDGIKTWSSLSYTTGETGPASEALKLNALTFNGSTTTFALVSGTTTVYPASAAALIISLNGVVQEPGVDYTVSGSDITFAQAPTNGADFFGISLNGIAAPITAASITSGTLDIARIPTGSTSSTVCIGNDARLSDTRTPTDGSVSTAKLANDAVTYAKLQNVSATDRLLGRSSAGAGDVEEITCTAFGRSLIDDADAAAARTTLSVQPTASPAFTGTLSAAAATFSGVVSVDPSASGTRLSVGPAFNNGTAVRTGDSDLTVQAWTGAPSLSLARNGANVWKFAIDSNGDLNLTQNGVRPFYVSSQLLVAAGSVSACSVAPSGDANTGLYFPAADTVALVTGGSERVRVDASGNVGIGGTAGTNIALDLYNGTGGGLPAIRLRDSAVDFRLYTSNAAVVSAISNHPLSFHTNSVERMRIDASGNVGIGTSPAALSQLHLAGTYPTSSNATQVIRQSGTIPSGTTNEFIGVLSAPATQAASFTLPTLRHFHANPQAFGAGSTVTDQYGFVAESSLTGATNNYGFLSAIASGTNRWNFYASGSAKNYFNGETMIGSTADQGAYNLQCNGTGVWGAGAYVNGSDERIKDDIAPLPSCTDVIESLRPVTFRYKESWSKDQNIQPGFVAQDLQQALAGQVYLDGVVQQGTEYLSVAYQTLIPLLVKALQESNARIAALEERLSND